MGEAAPKDNSMEEILASIRRIISSDDETPATGRKTVEGNTGKTPPSASAVNAAAAPQELSAEPQTSFRPQASTPAPAQGEAGTLAGLAQQLRGTKEQETPHDKPDTLTPETVSTQTDTIEADISKSAQSEPAEAGVDDADTDAMAPSGAASASSTQNLADLAKSINEKIGAASRKNNEQSDTDLDTDGTEIQVPEAAVEPLADGGEPSVEPKAEAAMSETLAGIAQSVQTDLQASNEDNAVADEKAIAGESEARETSPSVAGADGPEAFKEALVSPSTQQAVSGSMDRLKQAASELSQAQVEATLRPLLKEWLDDNLPGLVERMVQQEIDRIAALPVDNAVEENLPEDSLLQSKSA